MQVCINSGDAIRSHDRVPMLDEDRVGCIEALLAPLRSMVQCISDIDTKLLIQSRTDLT